MDVIVIGGGMGGLSAGIQLAARGARVTLFEKNERVGGKLNVWSDDGFLFDTGPHVLTMLWAIDEIFAAAGRRLADAVDLIPLDTICRYHFPDGATLDAPADRDAATQAIAEFAPGEEQGFARFLDYARRVSDATTDPFLRNDFGASVHGAPTREQWGQLREFLALKPWRTLRDVVREHFSDPRLRDVFELYALYSGSHPARSSGIFATVADVQWRQGTYYVRGGLYKLAEALVELARDVGVSIQTSSPVREIIVKNGRARGVALENGARHYADAVVCNEDTLAAYKSLLAPQSRPHYPDRKADAVETSTSAFLLLLGVRGEYPQLAHHNSFLSTDLEAEFGSIFDRHRPADDPTVGVACQSVTDPSKAPPGCSNLFLMTNPPALSDAFDWTREAASYREIVLNKLEAMGLKGLRDRIVVEQMWTPLDLQSRYNARRGAVYGLSSNGWRNAFLRPPNVCPDVKGLYFVGGGTHPGGGLPLCALSGTNVARQLQANHRREFPS
ncbi:phytoene desaturase [Capsulimonas corticalis]|uniref:4,4'-diaponeurosporene oxygenase n=1 Tax=Capsulimonas corticalis TaxID=2219043 RepID=A0A402D6H0_9BACT|nr:phytoene desaturase family protein [Capsulimonas corticalis]BDI32472.1 phytoene desaturase [Capsulimonas corticalis]